MSEEVTPVTAEVPAIVPDATLEDIFSQYEIEDGEFEYTVGEGDKARKYRARRLVNLSEKIALAEVAETFRKLCLTPKSCPESWRPYLKKKLEKRVAIAIIFAETLLISPRITQLDGLRMAATCGDALLDIVNPVIGAVEQDATEGTYEEIDEAKND